MKKNLLELDLQLFAEEELGAEEQNFADSDEEFDGDESESDESNEVDDVEESDEDEEEHQNFKNEQNATYANMRRKAEAEAKAKADARIASICKGHVHPVTGKEITTLDEYEDALYHQARLQREAELRERGVDPEIIEQAIEQSPILRQAQEVIENSKKADAERRLQSEFAEIQKLDPTIKTFDDIPNMDSIQNMVVSGMSLLNAFKVANFDVLVERKAAGAKQNAINQMKGKSHMSGVDSLSNESSDVEIPEAEYRSLKEVFPDKSAADLKKLYNATLKKLGGK